MTSLGNIRFENSHLYLIQKKEQEGSKNKQNATSNL
jgi:hypothetical protein